MIRCRTALLLVAFAHPTLLLCACSDEECDCAGTPLLDVVEPDASGSGGETGPSLPDGVAGGELGDTGGGTADFGEPCSGNQDCLSGWCVASEDGPVCTRTCIEDCPEQWACLGVKNTGQDLTFICVPKSSLLCEPCLADSQCGDGLCVTLADGKACTRSCGDDDPCPEGFTCKDVASEADPDVVSLQCVPAGGGCTCSVKNKGEERPCKVQNEHGSCWGSQVCNGADGWAQCSADEPAKETCDGLDNDCNGVADDDPAKPAETCEVTNDAGTCKGAFYCTGSAGWKCTAKTPVEEACDLLDNDCDGQTDEDFLDAVSGLLLHPDHCGACGAACAGKIPFALTACELAEGTPTCVVAECLPGYAKVNDTSCLPLQQSLCMACAADTDCALAGDLCLPIGEGSYCGRDCSPGSVLGPECPAGYKCSDAGDGAKQCIPESGACDCLPQNAGVIKICSAKNEIGTCFGKMTCTVDAGWSACDAVPATLEECNGLDDDCDGVIDEAPLLPEAPCQTTWADPESGNVAVCGGKWTCVSSGEAPGWLCVAPAAGPDVCDYQDNDCDGGVDEDFRLGGTGPYADIANCGVCGSSCAGTIPNATAMCDVTGATPACVVDKCAPGYYQVTPTACLPVMDPSCQPCVSDAGCAFPGNRCLELDGSTRCVRLCGESSPYGDCGDGYECQETAPGEKHCVPVNGSCTCVVPDHEGGVRSCMKATALGTCTGVETCTLSGGWSACDAATPSKETCDGVDEDCDGLTDEGAAQPADPCKAKNEAGECAGSWVCGGDKGWTCNAPVPAKEACDFADNDCDGGVDEDFREGGLYLHPQHCGTCGVSCDGAVPFASEVGCKLAQGKPKCVALACAGNNILAGGDAPFCIPPGGGFDCSPCELDTHCSGLPGGACVWLDGGTHCARSCSTAGGCQSGYVCLEGKCVPPSQSCSCLAGDAADTRPCFAVSGESACFGTQSCDPAVGWSICNASEPAPESCDGFDNDCDGQVDEGVTHDPAACSVSNAHGTCKGTYVCKGDPGWACTAAQPAPEACDFADNDCDGGVDEDYRAGGDGPYVSDGHCGACGVSCQGAIPFATATCVLSDGKPRCEVKACAPGYFQVGPLTCLPATDATCQPCITDASCPTPGDLCLSLDGAKYCGRDCSAGNVHGNPAGSCPNGFACSGPGGGAQQCLPVSGSCSCLPKDAGKVRPCSTQSPAGTCFGEQTCDPAKGFGPCSAKVPVAETCNGLDDECDGYVDDVPGRGTPCKLTNEHGACTGILDCVAGKAALACAGKAPAKETCNGADDDCDGQTDEGFTVGGAYLLQEHCGKCGQDCGQVFTNGSGKCLAAGGSAKCVIDACHPGFVQLGDTQCVPAKLGLCDPCVSAASCVAVGAKCAALDDGTWCANPCSGDADCPKMYGCEALDGGTYCVPDTFACTCNGTNLALKKGCTATFTPPGGLPYQCLGAQSCTAAGWSKCAMPPEACNQLDDDCDGLTDEDFMDAGGNFASDENCGACGNDCTLLVFPGGGGACNTLVDPPICSMKCTGSCFDVNANPADGCECCDPAPVDHPDVGGKDSNCDGIDGEKDNGIFVSKEGDDILNDGTWGSPKRTIQAGVEAAAALGMRDVYVATGVYLEQVVLEPAVAVYGGYSSDFRKRQISLYETAILAPAPSPEMPGAVNAIGIKGGAPGSTALDGLSVFAAEVQETGGSSYGVYIKDCDATLRIANNAIHGGRGGDGARGKDGVAGADGVAGKPGKDALDLLLAYGVGDHACQPAHHSPGGAGGAAACGGKDVGGGLGGNRICPKWDAATGKTAPPVASESGASGQSGGAAGGKAGWDVDHQAYQCLGFATFGPLEGENGADGSGGSAGASGPGCKEPAGSIVAGLWSPGKAGDGTAGTHGGGGGGGGSGAGAWVHQSCYSKGFGYDNLGGTGGGGGSGGCGGTAGIAGLSAGGAFGIFATFGTVPASLPVLQSNKLHGGIGGRGGDGGNAGTGGAGGAGGFGGADGGVFEPPDPTYPAYEGGKGGKGGNGGHAGGGGGGCGGPAYGIYAAGTGSLSLSKWTSDNAVVKPGIGGAGGHGGFSLGQAGGGGAPGAVAATSF